MQLRPPMTNGAFMGVEIVDRQSRCVSYANHVANLWLAKLCCPASARRLPVIRRDRRGDFSTFGTTAVRLRSSLAEDVLARGAGPSAFDL